MSDSIKDQLHRMGLVGAAVGADRPIADLVEDGRLPGRIAGNRRFYYEARDGRVPYLELDDAIAKQLELGAAAIAEAPSGRITLIGGATAASIVERDAQWVRFWAG